MIDIYVVKLDGVPVYVGCTINSRRRRGQHQKRWPGSTYEVLETVEPGTEVETEARWIAHYGREFTLANKHQRATAPSVMSKLKTGKKIGPFSAQHKANLSAALRGRTISDEARARMSKPRSEAGKANMRKPKSDAGRAAIAEAQRRRWSDPAQREAMAEAQRRRFADPAARAAMAESQRRRYAERDQKNA